MPEEKRNPKKINWEVWRSKCSKCGSTDIEPTGSLKMSWVSKLMGKKDEKYEKWELKELEEYVCKDCKNKWWNE